jgi:hypothetical protein
MIAPPYTSLIENEQTHLFMCYCTFIMNINGKKMSVQNVFVYTLQNEKMKSLLKDILSIDTDYEVVKIFLEFDPSLVKSKYVTKYLNSCKKNKKNAKNKR